MDGHSSHVSLPLSKFCHKNGIELIALYPNATHVLQPMDVAVFHTMKTVWRQQVQNFRMQNGGKQVDKAEFPKILRNVLPYVTPKIIENGFKKCGLVPWDPNQVKLPSPSNNNPKTTHAPNNLELETFLNLLEKQIGVEKVQAFKETNENWEGAIEDKSLYELWKKSNMKVNSKKNNDIEEPPQKIHPNASPQNRNSDELRNQHTPVKQICQNFSTNSSHTSPSFPSTSTGITQSNTGIVLDCLVESDVYIPTPFKKNLTWPLAHTDPKKKRVKVKIPAVVTSPQMIQYLHKKEELKKKKEEEKQKRKQLREAKKLVIEEKKKMAAEEKKKRKRQLSSSSESIISMDEVNDSEIEEINVNDHNEEITQDIRNVNKDDLKEGDFILVKFMGGKRNTTEFIYLCVVENLDDLVDDMVQVMGLKRVDTANKEFVVDEKDVSNILFNQILGIVSHPEISLKGERFRYIFKHPLNVKEM